MKETHVLTLKIIKVGVYFGPPFYGYALNWHFVYLTIPGTPQLSMIKFCFIYM